MLDVSYNFTDFKPLFIVNSMSIVYINMDIW